MTLIALTGLDGSAAQFENQEVCSLTTVPTALAPVGINGTYVATENGKQFPVQGNVAAVRALLIAPGDISLITLAALDGSAPAVNPTQVSALTATAAPVSAGTYVDTSDGRRLVAAGTVAANAALIAVGTAGSSNSQAYVPVITSSGAGARVVIGNWNALRIGNLVHVIGAVNFAPAVAGVAETLSITLPSQMQPAVVFANASDANGIANIQAIVAATDACTRIIAEVGGVRVRTTVTTNAANADIAIAFTYAVA